MGGSSDVVVGYKYLLGIHMVLGWTVDRISDIVVGDRSLIDTNPGVFPITSSGTETINSPNLFGGDEREGGVQGRMSVSFGDVATPNTYLTSQLGSRVPAYRNVTSVISEKMHLTSMNPYIKPWMYKVRRTTTTTDGSAMWYSSAADIGGQANPAHIIYQVLTNSQWGMGYPTSAIDDTNFRAAADTFVTEGFGMWLKWSSSSKIRDVIAEVQRTVDCILYQDAASGLFRIKVIRNDYDTGTVPAFDESNIISVNKFQHRGWGETINEVTVEFTDVENRGKMTPVTIQDLGNIQMQGHVVSQTKKYPGITTADLASRVCSRDLRALSSPLAELKIQVNRSAWDLGIGDVFKFSWEKYGIVATYFRVSSIKKGTLSNGTIVINALEDVFSLPDAAYVTPQPPSWTIPNNKPVPVPRQMAMFVGFWDVSQKLPQANINTLDPDFAGAIVNATVETTDTYNYRIYAEDVQDLTGTGSPSSFCQVDVAIDNVTTSIQVRNGERLLEVVKGPRKYIAINDELMRLDDITLQTRNLYATLTVSRGALDTVPTAHNVGDDVWFPAQYGGWETTVERLDGENVTYRLLPRTGYGTLDSSDPGITPLSIILYDRYQRPYPPGYLQVNGEYLPPDVDINTIVFTWQHRNRLLETGNIICKDDDNGAGVIDPDDRPVVYWIELLDHLGGTVTGYPKNMGTALTETYDNLSTLYPEMTVKLWAQYTDGTALQSWQTFTHTFLTAGGAQHDQTQHNIQEHL